MPMYVAWRYRDLSCDGEVGRKDIFLNKAAGSNAKFESMYKRKPSTVDRGTTLRKSRAKPCSVHLTPTRTKHKSMQSIQQLKQAARAIWPIRQATFKQPLSNTRKRPLTAFLKFLIAAFSANGAAKLRSMYVYPDFLRCQTQVEEHCF